jgi:hypothetical protein
MRAVRDHSRSLVEDPDRLDGVAALDLDETSFLRARTAPTPWITGLVALEGGPLLDVVADRTRATVDGWLGVRPDSWPDHIAMVAQIPGAGTPARWRPHSATPGWSWPLPCVRLANMVVEQLTDRGRARLRAGLAERFGSKAGLGQRVDDADALDVGAR